MYVNPSSVHFPASSPVSKRARTEMDVKTMSSKAYMDEMVVPTMLRALSAVNKEVSR